ncbi:hypothetical protein FQA39_LY02484 [Lamprigera yunnana]|nr:hypothetical protein FQA39_LY02484 [Lamprigera yunnana]
MLNEWVRSYMSEQTEKTKHGKLYLKKNKSRVPIREDLKWKELKYILLLITEPITEILGGPDLFINQGSTINLTCLVQYAPEPPPVMLWSHNSVPINFDSPRGGISLVTEKGPTTTSRLLIQKASQSDSGTYTCSPSNANPGNARVHILNDF